MRILKSELQKCLPAPSNQVLLLEHKQSSNFKSNQIPKSTSILEELPPKLNHIHAQAMLICSRLEQEDGLTAFENYMRVIDTIQAATDIQIRYAK